PEGATGAQTTAAWCRAGLCKGRTREGLTEAMESRSAAPHPSMAHRSRAHRLWPTADPRPAAPPHGAWVAGRHLSAVSGLDPCEIGAAAAPAAREPGRVPGPCLPEPRCPAPACRSDHALPLAAVLLWPDASVRRWRRARAICAATARPSWCAAT